MLQNTHLLLLKCIQLWGRWDLFILPFAHCHILTCGTCSRENPHFLKFCAVTRAVGQSTPADNLHVAIKKERNCHDRKSVRQGVSPGETDDGWPEMWGIVTENTCGLNFPGCFRLAADMSQFSPYQQSID